MTHRNEETICALVEGMQKGLNAGAGNKRELYGYMREQGQLEEVSYPSFKAYFKWYEDRLVIPDSFQIRDPPRKRPKSPPKKTRVGTPIETRKRQMTAYYRLQGITDRETMARNLGLSEGYTMQLARQFDIPLDQKKRGRPKKYS